MSWIEVESKIHVKNVAGMKRKIERIARYIGVEKKVDDYYALNYRGGYPAKSLRVRQKGKKVEVNFKQRQGYIKGVHAKKEVEFDVSDLKGFFDLLGEFGFKKWIRKEKKSELYKTEDGVGIELNYVKGLGWFVEIEILCSKKNVAKARKRVAEIIELLGVESNDIEKLGYTRALWNLKKKK